MPQDLTDDVNIGSDNGLVPSEQMSAQTYVSIWCLKAIMIYIPTSLFPKCTLLNVRQSTNEGHWYSKRHGDTIGLVQERHNSTM